MTFECHEGSALVCDAQGTVLEILHDECHLESQVDAGQSFVRLIDRDSISKALAFLEALKNQGSAFGWQLNVTLSDEICTLSWGGIRYDDSYILFVGRTSAQVLELYEKMMRINNEQMNELRRFAKDNQTLTAQMERDDSLYEELSRLNNELVNLQRELARKNRELERLNEQKNEFLGMVSHDLRNPLSIIMMYSEFLLDETGEVLDEEQYNFLSVIYSSSEFMLHMVNDLLDIAQIESGKLSLSPEPTDLVWLVEQNVSLNQALAARKEIQLELSHDDDIPELMIDGAKIEQVLNNLVSNAIKFSHPGSRVSIALECVEDQVVVSVQDQGQGIPSAELSKLFKPFSRTSVKGTAGEKSTGLGLAIARRIVEGHGGRIWAESKVGEGSTFYFLLPLSEVAVAGKEEKADVESRSAEAKIGPLRILVAEDSLVNQRIVQRVLERVGHEADTVANGQEVLEAFHQQPYDLVLMDVHMPEMGGLEATRQIREQFSAQDQPVIVAMTASGQTDDRERCLEAGMDDYLTKPIKAEKLETTLASYFDGH